MILACLQAPRAAREKASKEPGFVQVASSATLSIPYLQTLFGKVKGYSLTSATASILVGNTNASISSSGSNLSSLQFSRDVTLGSKIEIFSVNFTASQTATGNNNTQEFSDASSFTFLPTATGFTNCSAGTLYDLASGECKSTFKTENDTVSGCEAPGYCWVGFQQKLGGTTTGWWSSFSGAAASNSAPPDNLSTSQVTISRLATSSFFVDRGLTWQKLTVLQPSVKISNSGSIALQELQVDTPANAPQPSIEILPQTAGSTETTPAIQISGSASNPGALDISDASSIRVGLGRSVKLSLPASSTFSLIAGSTTQPTSGFQGDGTLKLQGASSTTFNIQGNLPSYVEVQNAKVQLNGNARIPQ